MGTTLNNCFLIFVLSCVIFSEDVHSRPESKDGGKTEDLNELYEHLKDALKEHNEALEEHGVVNKTLDILPHVPEVLAPSEDDGFSLSEESHDISNDSHLSPIELIVPEVSEKVPEKDVTEVAEEVPKNVTRVAEEVTEGVPEVSEEVPEKDVTEVAEVSEEPEEETSGDFGIGSGSGSGDSSGFESSLCIDDEDCGTTEIFVSSNEEPLKVMCTQTDSFRCPWWRVDLQGNHSVEKIVIYNRAQRFHSRLHDVAIRVGEEEISSTYREFTSNALCAFIQGELPPGENVIVCNEPVAGRFVSIQITQDYYNILTLCEVEVYGSDNQNLALKKPVAQSGEDWGGKADRANDGVVAAQFFAGEEHLSCLNPAKFALPSIEKLGDCADIYLQAGRSESGVYTIHPKGWTGSDSFQVFCDMTKDGGGWTSILRRHFYLDHSESFHRFSNDYAEGFGNLCEEFWIGNDKLHILTMQNSVQLKVEIHDSYGNDLSAVYEKFFILNKDHEYQMHVHGYSGDAGDYLKSGVVFSMRKEEGGWWWHMYSKEGEESFLGCNPNGDLWYGRNLTEPITWGCQECHADQPNYYIQFLDMKIRPDWFERQKAASNRRPWRGYWGQ